MVQVTLYFFVNLILITANYTEFRNKKYNKTHFELEPLEPLEKVISMKGMCAMFGKKKQSFDGITVYTAFHHVNGLPIAENLLCEVFSYPDRIEFKAGTTNIKLARGKITDMCVKTDTEIQTQAVSSVGGAIAGGVMFGALGAIIGGRSKNKKVKTTTQYLIITYAGEQGELKYIGFDTKNNPPSAAKLVKEFRELNTNSEIQIEL